MNIPGPAKQRLAAVIGAGVVALVWPCTAYFEGRVHHAYRDPVGILTACDGHTGPDVRVGQMYTDAQCDDLLASDLYTADHDIGQCVDVGGLTDGERAAFDDFALNAGATKFCGSSMARKIKAGDVMGACAELSRWVYAGGRVLPGLVKRRARERAICEGRA